MPSPSRPLRGSPLRRGALHERTDSHTNERAGPTLRLVGEPQANVYNKTPYPTKSSQILPPQEVSYLGHDSTVASILNPYAPTPYYNPAPRKASDTSVEIRGGNVGQRAQPIRQDTQQSSTDASVRTASTRDSPPPNSPPPDTSTSFLSMDQQIPDTTGFSDDIVELPSVEPRPHPISPLSSSNPADFAERRPAPKDSDTSLSSTLSSTNSTGTMVVRKNRDGRNRASYSAFPYTGRPSSSKSNISISPAQGPLRTGPDEGLTSSSPVSPSSPVLTPLECRISSAPGHIHFPRCRPGDGKLQYPTTKPVSASASWAELSFAAPQRPARGVERNQERWNPHLSTVPSEGTGSGSYSGGRTIQRLWSPDSSRASGSSSNILNSRISSDQPPLPRASSELPTIAAAESEPPALPSSPPNYPSLPPLRQRDGTGSTIRLVNEHEVGGPNTLQAIPGSRDSEHVGPTPGEKRGNIMWVRPGSRASFFRDSIPAWAK